MKAIEIDIDSKFNRYLCSFYAGLRQKFYQLSFCEYCRYVLCLVLAHLIALGVVQAVGGSILALSLPEFFETSSLWITQPISLIIGISVFALSISLFSLMGILFGVVMEAGSSLLRRLRKNDDGQDNPSLFVEGYRALRDKVCFRIKPVKK